MAQAREDLIKRFVTDKIIEAVREGDKMIIEECLKKGADINTRDSSGNPVIMGASPAIIIFLLDHGADPNSRDLFGTPLICKSASSNHVATLQKLIEKKADVNASTQVGNTALMSSAVNHTNLKAVELLVNAGADILATNQKGETVLDQLRATNSYDMNTQREKTKIENYLLFKLPNIDNTAVPRQTAPLPDLPKKPLPPPAPGGS